MALLMVAFVAGCGNGGGGRDPILGGAGSPILNLVSIKVTPPSPSIAKGTTQQFTATGFYADGTTKILTTSVVWSSTPFAPAAPTVIATISNVAGSNGLATSCGVGTTLCSAGTTTITATLGTISGIAALNITNATLISIAVSPLASSVPTVAVGSTLPFIATGTFSDSTTQDLTSSVNWADLPLAAASAVASISSTTPTNGLATGLVIGGPDTITATDLNTGITSHTLPLVGNGDSTLTVIAAPSILGTAATYGTFGGSAGMTNQGILTQINNGDIGTIATGTSAITGFHDSNGDIYTETGANIGAVSGKIYTCTVSTTGPTSGAVNAASCALATQARLDATTAYGKLAAMPVGGASPPPPANLAGLTLLPGVYAAPAGSFMIQGGDLTLDPGTAGANAVWVFQMATTLLVGGPGAANPQSVIVLSPGLAKNVFWQVGSAATINAAGGGTMVGTIISQAGADFSTAGNTAVVTLNGQVLSLGASVTLVDTVINVQ